MDCGDIINNIGDGNVLASDAGAGGSDGSNQKDCRDVAPTGFWVRELTSESATPPFTINPDGGIWTFTLGGNLGEIERLSVTIGQTFKETPDVAANIGVEMLSKGGEIGILGGFVVDKPSSITHDLTVDLEGFEPSPGASLRVRLQAPLGMSPQAKLDIVAGPILRVCESD